MKSIDILVKEHDHILKVLEVIRKACMGILEGKNIDHNDFYNMIDFIRNYADKYHHKKEEDMLFLDMSNHLGETVKNGPIQGMLIEHDLGRKFVGNLETAVKKHEKGIEDAKLDIIANAISYANLLQEHIEKENTAIYTFAQRQLKEDVKSKLDKEFEEYEEAQEHQEEREKYIAFVKELEKKYLI